MTTTKNAYIEMMQSFEDGWKANAAVVTGYVPEIRFALLEKGAIPDASKFWVRMSVDAVFEEQTSLATKVGDVNQRRYTHSGLVFVQIFCPKQIKNAGLIGFDLAEVAKRIFRGKRIGCTFFRNVRTINVDPEQDYYRLNVVAEYEHDEIN